MAVPAPVDICNLALQKLGCNKIASFKPPDNSPNARAVTRVYYRLLDAMLRDYQWTFAIQRFQLAAGTTPPLFGYTYSYPLPAGWRKIVPILNKEQWYWGGSNGSNGQAGGSPLGRDYSLEGNSILTNRTSPLNVRLVMYIDDTTKFDSCFDEALATMIAIEICEELTQSNTKKASLQAEFKQWIDAAKFANAIENPPHESPRTPTSTVRL